MIINEVATGITFIGTQIEKLTINNSITELEDSDKRSFGLDINAPELMTEDGKNYAELAIELVISIKKNEDQHCDINLVLKGAFLNTIGDVTKFKKLVEVNGAAALIGVARGKIESISSSVFNSGKIVLPFINVLEYYKSKTR